MVYGFHPDEPLAEKIGENLARGSISGVKAIRFRPSYMPDHLHHLPEEEATKITLDGIKELKRFIKKSYDRFGFVLSLHETPLPVEPSHPKFTISFPGWNWRLREVLERFEEEYHERVWVLGHAPKGYPTYHSAIIEYYSKIKKDNDILILTKDNGEKFALDLINYLKKSYLRKL